jgi:hypothetical protein
MLDAIKPLVDSGIINEETRQSINEAWDTQLNEARDQIRQELREEFANRYEHDRKAISEAVDAMVTETLTAEVAEFQAEKQAYIQDRVTAKVALSESAGKFDDFLISSLAEEINELRADRTSYKTAAKQLERFIAEQLASEIKEFRQDKRAVVETKVKLVAEAKTKMAKLQQQFVQRSAVMVKEAVAQHLNAELTQLKEDVKVARENMFGRRLYEAFAGEFAVTHLNENKEMGKLKKTIQQQATHIAEARKVAHRATKLAESKDKEVQAIKASGARAARMGEMLGTLNKEKATVMRDLLESVQTDRLQSAFDKYLPAVLGETGAKKSTKTTLSESRVQVTGDKSAKVNATDYIDNNVIEIKRLAGLK